MEVKFTSNIYKRQTNTVPIEEPLDSEPEELKECERMSKTACHKRVKMFLRKVQKYYKEGSLGNFIKLKAQMIKC